MNIIPEMTNELGRYWGQPSTKSIELDDTHALMSEYTFCELYEYSSTVPSGVYEGKMWKAQINGIWYLRWYGKSELLDHCSNNSREILLV